MKFRQIVGFGDSWVWGDELLDPKLQNTDDAFCSSRRNVVYRESHCFLGLLGQHYQVPVLNLSWPGSSLQSTIWSYLWWLNNHVDTKDTLVLVAHTVSSRHSFYNPEHRSFSNDPPWNKFVHDSWVHSSQGSHSDTWVDMIKLHTVLTDCVELHKLKYQQSVLFFEGQNTSKIAGLVQFCSLTPPTVIDTSSLIWPDSSLDQMLPCTNEFRYKGGHPNEFGHQLIQKHLISAIDNAIL